MLAARPGPTGSSHSTRYRAALAVMELQVVDLSSSFSHADGQLRMDAPDVSSRFKRTHWLAAIDEGLRTLQRQALGSLAPFTTPIHLSTGRWDAACTWASPSSPFSPRAGLVHLAAVVSHPPPPPRHGTFVARRSRLRSLRAAHFSTSIRSHPLPHPHLYFFVAACATILFYARRATFPSRSAWRPAASHSPTGIPHGPHPGVLRGRRSARDRPTSLCRDAGPTLPRSASRPQRWRRGFGYHDSIP